MTQKSYYICKLFGDHDVIVEAKNYLSRLRKKGDHEFASQQNVEITPFFFEKHRAQREEPRTNIWINRVPDRLFITTFNEIGGARY